MSQDLHDKINACSMPQGASGAIRESILRRLVLRDRKTDVALRVSPIPSLFHTAWTQSRRWVFGRIFGLDGRESYRELRLEAL